MYVFSVHTYSDVFYFFGKRKYVYNNDSIRNSGDNDNNSNSNNNTNNLNRSDKSQYINRNIDSCEIIIFRTNSENRPSSLRD